LSQEPANRAHDAEQGALFDSSEMRSIPDDLGYRGPVAGKAAGISYRQLDYWARTNLVEPSIRGASGSGSQRLYSFRDILVLKSLSGCLTRGFHCRTYVPLCNISASAVTAI
jgi:hypothetical protein